MMNLVKFNYDFIERIEDNSIGLITWYWVYFTNGIILSVIRGENTLGNKDGLFEIMIINRDYANTYFNRNDMIRINIDHDDVIGYLSHEDLVSYIIGIGSLVPMNLPLDNSQRSSIMCGNVKQLIN